MESVLHSIEELQRMAEDLALGTGLFDMERYELDGDKFIGAIEAYVGETVPENHDYIVLKLIEVRSNLKKLLYGRVREETDLGRYQAQMNNGLNGIYRSMRRPAVQGEGDYGPDE